MPHFLGVSVKPSTYRASGLVQLRLCQHGITARISCLPVRIQGVIVQPRFITWSIQRNSMASTRKLICVSSSSELTTVDYRISELDDLLPWHVAEHIAKTAQLAAAA